MGPVQYCRLQMHRINNEYKFQLVSPIIFILLSAKEYHALICLHWLPQSRSKESRGQPRVDLTTPVAVRPALCGLRLLVFIGVWWFLDRISAILLLVVWRWWCLYYERPSDSRKGVWKRKVLALPTKFGFL